ncbi:hypothetical protein E2320_018434, partial [Naja naja]
MATRLFEDKDHAAFYKKYRISLQENLRAVILEFLEKKVKMGERIALGLLEMQSQVENKRLDIIIWQLSVPPDNENEH